LTDLREEFGVYTRLASWELPLLQLSKMANPWMPKQGNLFAFPACRSGRWHNVFGRFCIELALFDLETPCSRGQRLRRGRSSSSRKASSNATATRPRTSASTISNKAARSTFSSFSISSSRRWRQRRDSSTAGTASSVQRRIAPIIREKGRSLLRQHQDRGSLCAIHHFDNASVTRADCARTRRAHLLADRDRGNRRPLHGAPAAARRSSARAKIERLNQWLIEPGLQVQFVLGELASTADSHNDLPLLEAVTHPVAVDPDDLLRPHRAGTRLGSDKP